MRFDLKNIYCCQQTLVDSGGTLLVAQLVDALC
jgi:hypothetical protein